MMLTDCHAHIYSPDETHFPMIENPLRPPTGTGTLEHLRREMAANGVQRVVAIQTSTAYRWDNRFLTHTARANAPWMVGVCTLNPDDPGSPELLRRYVADCRVRGLRSVPAGGPERPQLDHPGVDALWAAAEDLGIVVNVLIHVEHADELERLLKRHRRLRVVLDHCMYPRGHEGLGGTTIQRALALASHPNLYAKLTWLVDTSDSGYPFGDTHPLLRAIVDAYGPERCVWGSDFPCELWTPKASYATSLRLFREALGLTQAQLGIILERVPGELWFSQ